MRKVYLVMTEDARQNVHDARAIVELEFTSREAAIADFQEYWTDTDVVLVEFEINDLGVMSNPEILT